MRRMLALAFALGLLAAACGGSAPLPPPSTTSASTTPASFPPSSPSASASASASVSTAPEPHIQLPSDAPTKYGQPVASDQVPLADIAPPDAQVTDERRVPPTSDAVPQIAFAWTRGSDPFAAEHGFEVWQQFPDEPVWRVVYAFTDSADAGVLGIRFETGDLTGDGIEDLLTFEDMGGSGGCGVWRVVESGVGFAAEIFDKHTCDTNVQIGAGTLQVDAAVYLPGDAHCCPSKTRHTTLEWDGTAWQVTSKTVTAND